MEITYDTFNLPTPQVIKPGRVSKRNRKPIEILSVDQKEDITFFKKATALIEVIV